MTPPPIDLVSRWFDEKRSFVVPFLVFLCAEYVGMLFLPPLLDPYLYTNDMNQNLAWAHRLQDPELFPSDPSIAYNEFFIGRGGYRALCWILTRFVDVQTAGELFAIAVAAGMLGAGYLFGQHLSRTWGAVVSVTTLCAMRLGSWADIWSYSFGGLPRSVAYPGLVLLAAGLVAGRAWPLMLATLVGYAVYPPLLLMCVVALGCYCGFDWILMKRSRSTAFHFVTLGIGVALLGISAVTLGRAGEARFGTVTRWDEAVTMWFFQVGGGMPYVLAPTWEASVIKSAFGIPPVLPAAIIVYAVSARIVRARSREVEVAALTLVCCGFLTYTVSYALFVKLYHPHRYATPYFVAAWMLLATACIHLLPFVFSRAGSLPARRPAVVAGALIVAIAANAYRVWPRQSQPDGRLGLYRSPFPVSVLKAVEHLPKEARIASDLANGASIPFLARRSVDVHEMDLFPYHREFYRSSMARALAMERALCTSDLSVLEEYVRQSGVSHFVTSKEVCAVTTRAARFFPDLPEIKGHNAQPAILRVGEVLAGDPDGYQLLRFAAPLSGS